MTGLPAITIEIALTGAPSSATPVWTDCTTWWASEHPLTWTHGRPDEFGEVQPGTMSLTLKNTNGQVTGAGSLTGRRIRLSLVHNAVTYRRFDGYINSRPVSWPGGGRHSMVTITCTDHMRKLGRARKLRSILQEEVLGDGPVAYWPLGEPEASQIAADISGPATNLKVTQAGAGGTLTFGSGIGPPSDGLPAVVTAPVDLDNGKYLLTGAVPGAVVGGICTIEAWFVAPTGVPSSTTVMGVVFDDRRTYIQAYFATAGGLSLTSTVYNSALAPFTAAVGTAAVMTNSLLHHMVGVLTVTTTSVKVTLYVDGVLIGNTTTAATGTAILPTAITSVAVGAFPTRYGLAEAFGLHRGTLAHAAVYGKTLTPAQVLAHYTAGKTGFAGERSDVRVARLARYTGLPTGRQALDAGASTIAAQSVADSQALPLMQQVAQAEGGVLYVAGDGKLTLQSRTRRINLTSAFTLDAASGQVGADIVFVRDDSYVYNDVTYSRPGGAAQRSVKTGSMDGEIYEDSGELVLTTDGAVKDRADWRVNVYAVDKDRCSNVKVDLLTETSTSLIASVLAADISTQLTVSNLPSTAPATTANLIVEGVTETLSVNEWSVEFNTSPTPGVTVWAFDTVTTEPLTFGF